MKIKDDPLLDLEMCIICHQEADRLIEKMGYYKAVIRERMKFIRHPEITPKEPPPPANKPEKPEPPRLGFKDRIPLTKSPKKAEFEQACEEYNHRLKQYYIEYREYEKACDRYKEALQKWEVEKDRLLARSHEDVKQARKNIKKGNRLLKMYLEVIQNSQIHTAYQEIEVLCKFKAYLETSRANTIQDCINLYEVETRWDRIRGSQERLENQLIVTINFLQNDLTQVTAPAACAQDNDMQLQYSPINRRRFFFFRRKKQHLDIPEFKLRRPQPASLNLLSRKLSSIKYRVLKLRPF